MCLLGRAPAILVEINRSMVPSNNQIGEERSGLKNKNSFMQIMLIIRTFWTYPKMPIKLAEKSLCLRYVHYQIEVSNS